MTSSSESTFFFLHDRVVNWADLTCHTVLVQHVQKIPIEANKAIINTIPFFATTLMDHYCHGRRQMAIHNSQSIESLEECEYYYYFAFGWSIFWCLTRTPYTFDLYDACSSFYVMFNFRTQGEQESRMEIKDHQDWTQETTNGEGANACPQKTWRKTIYRTKRYGMIGYCNT